MSRSRIKIGRRTPRANAERRRRSNRTDQERLDDNERVRVRSFQRRKEEPAHQREERLEVLRLEARKRCAREHEQGRRMRLQHLINQVSDNGIASSYEPDIQYKTIVKIEKIDKICPHCKAMTLEGETLRICCANGNADLEPEQPKAPTQFFFNSITDESTAFFKNLKLEPVKPL